MSSTETILSSNKQDLSGKAEKVLVLENKESVNLLLSLLSNRSATNLKLKLYGKAYEDASFAICIYLSHIKEMKELDISFVKLNYRKLLSLDKFLNSVKYKISNCENEFLKYSMLENLTVYVVELRESADIILKENVEEKTLDTVKKIKDSLDWFNSEMNELKLKKEKNWKLTEKRKESFREIPTTPSTKNENREIPLSAKTIDSFIPVGESPEKNKNIEFLCCSFKRNTS